VVTGYAPVDGGKLYYEVAGAGSVVVLIHGGQMDRRMWDPQFRRYAAQYRVIRYDVRGFGNSPAATRPFSDEDDLAALLTDLRVDRATIVGLSLGGRIAIDFALSHPERVSSLVLVAPGLSGFHFPSEAGDDSTWAAAQRGDWAAVASWWTHTGYMTPAMHHPDLADRLRQLAQDNAHQWLDNPALERPLRPAAIDQLGAIHTPTLIVVGNRDVADIHQIVGLLSIRIAGARLTIVPDAGHMVNLEARSNSIAQCSGFSARGERPKANASIRSG
jgi:3-oxoadipate enol-lactonase